MATSSVPHVATGVNGEKIFDTTCSSCREDGVRKEGLYHCNYCGVLCESCSTKHTKETKHKGHWAQKLRILLAEVDNPSFTSVRNCEIHRDKKIRGYCTDCGQLMCSECDLNHESCTIESIEDMSSDVIKNKDIREARMDLADLKNRTKRARRSKMDEMIYVAKQADEFTKTIHGIREKINILFDKMVKTILQDKDEFCKAESELIQADVKTCEEIFTILESVIPFVDAAYKSNKNDDIWVVKKKLEHFLLHYDNIISRTEGESDVKFEFVPNASLSAILQTPENVGKMKVVSSRLHGDSTEVVSRLVQNPKRRKFFKLPWKEDRPEDNLLQPWVKSTRISRAVNPLPAIIRKSTEPRADSETFRGLPHQSPTYPANSRMSMVNGRTPTFVGRQSVTGGVGSVINSHRSVGAGSVIADRTFVATDRLSVGRSIAASTAINTPSNINVVDSGVAEGDAIAGVNNIKLSVLGKKEIQMPSDTEKCCVTGSEFLPSGRLVLVDNHNKNIKLFSSDFEFLAVMALEERPWDVTSCVNSLVAVTCPFANIIELITAESEMVIDNTLKTDRMCHGVVFNPLDKWLYVTTGDFDHARIQAFSLDGILRKVIIPAADVLQSPSYMTMAHDNSTLYVSDRQTGIVGFKTKSGDMACQYRDPKIKRHWDIEATPDGRLFILTTDPDCLFISLGDYNGHLLMTFREGPKPCSLCYRASTNTLVITRWTSEVIETFKLTHV